MTISRRPETPDDQPFIWRLMLERTAQELPLGHLQETLRDQILEMQARLRLSAVRANRGAAAGIILADAEPAGWLCVQESENEVRLIEIMVLAQYRGRGIGTAVITELAGTANASHKHLRLRVNSTNGGAIRLYERLGFRRTGGDEVQHEMEIAGFRS
jgi:ribosomal protein S18 acetylase RimI-like enzyme